MSRHAREEQQTIQEKATTTQDRAEAGNIWRPSPRRLAEMRKRTGSVKMPLTAPTGNTKAPRPRGWPSRNETGERRRRGKIRCLERSVIISIQRASTKTGGGAVKRRRPRLVAAKLLWALMLSVVLTLRAPVAGAQEVGNPMSRQKQQQQQVANGEATLKSGLAQGHRRGHETEQMIYDGPNYSLAPSLLSTRADNFDKTTDKPHAGDVKTHRKRPWPILQRQEPGEAQPSPLAHSEIREPGGLDNELRGAGDGGESFTTSDVSSSAEQHQQMENVKSYLVAGRPNDLQLPRRDRTRTNKKRESFEDSSAVADAELQTGTTGFEMLLAEIGEQTDAKTQCRVEKDLYLPLSDYMQYTCVNCYNQVPRESFKQKLVYRRRTQAPSSAPTLHEPQTGRQVNLRPETQTLIKSTFKDESIFDKWQACCRHALECCLENSRSLKALTNKTTDQLEDEPLPRPTCPATWDGLTCWPESPAGQLAWRECPRHVYLLSFEPACAGQVTKQCFPNGSWFIRNEHEWSDYSQCPNLPVYAKRMQFSALWHIISALVITPALLTIDKFSNRGGNKRVKILRNLLFWLLINSIIQAIQKAAIVGGLFEADSRGRPSETQQPQPVARPLLNGTTQLNSTIDPSAGGLLSLTSPMQPPPSGKALLRSRRMIGAADQSSGDSLRLLVDKYERLSPEMNDSGGGGDNDEVRGQIRSARSASRRRHEDRDWLTKAGRSEDDDELPLRVEPRFDAILIAQSRTAPENNIPSDRDKSSGQKRSSKTTSRCKRQTVASSSLSDSPTPMPGAPPSRPPPPPNRPGVRRQRSALITLFCWFLVVASRTVRLMGYSWMFTGAIYLCSALHFAPAEPPAAFIRILMIMTNLFPIVIALTYVTSRTIAEPSPLNIIFKAPYYKFIGDQDSVEYLWQTQLECWFDQSKYESIEDIADLPNLILICLNVGLFVITLIILCRINRPGSTRPDMSPLTYFKAAGTLVVLYGGHYALLAYRPNSESCFLDTVLFYSFLFVDGIQGMAVSYVFCYRTQEGQMIVKKYWSTKHERVPFKWFYKWLCCCCCSKPQYRTKNNHSTISRSNNGHLSLRSNQSTRSNLSACNGATGNTVGVNETVTELINVNDTSTASQF